MCDHICLCIKLCTNNSVTLTNVCVKISLRTRLESAHSPSTAAIHSGQLPLPFHFGGSIPSLVRMDSSPKLSPSQELGVKALSFHVKVQLPIPLQTPDLLIVGIEA